MMMKLDSDQDGRISRAEAAAGDGKMAPRFDQMDANKDGQVTAEERQAARQAMRGKRGAPPAPPASN